jgi:hypothetical protein
MRRRILAPTVRDLDAVASAATYTGCPTHKDTASFAGHPRPRRTDGVHLCFPLKPEEWPPGIEDYYG